MKRDGSAVAVGALVLVVLTVLAQTAGAESRLRTGPDAWMLEESDTVEDILHPELRSKEFGLVLLPAEAPTQQAEFGADPAIGWTTNTQADFAACTSSTLDSASSPGDLLLASDGSAQHTWLDLEADLEGLTVSDTGFTIEWTGEDGAQGAGCVRVHSTGSSTQGWLNLISGSYDTTDWPTFSLAYKAEPAFSRAEVWAFVEGAPSAQFLGALGATVDYRFTYDGTWRLFTVDLGALLDRNLGVGSHVVQGIILWCPQVTNVGDCLVDDIQVEATAFRSSGEWVSGPHRVPAGVRYRRVYWSGDAPIGTSISVQWRTASSEPGLAGAQWCGPDGGADSLEVPDAEYGYTDIDPGHDGDEWLQCRLLFQSAVPYRSPVLHHITFTYGEINTWDNLFVICRNTDADYVDQDGAPQHATEQFTEEEIAFLRDQIAIYDAETAVFANFQLEINSACVVIDQPITQLEGDAESGYGPTYSELEPAFASEVTRGQYDSIIGLVKLGPIPVSWWGVAVWWGWGQPDGSFWGGCKQGAAGGAALIYINYIDWAAASHHEVMLHEWEHHLDAALKWKAPYFGVPMSDHWDDHPEYDHSNKASMDFYIWLLTTYITPRMWLNADATDPMGAPQVSLFLKCGTWTNAADDALGVDFVGETSIRPGYGDVADGRSWDVGAINSNGILDFAAYYQLEYAAAYAAFYALSPVAQTARMWTGSDDGIAAWLNGDPARWTHVHRGYEIDEDITLVDLRRGWNALLLKVENNQGAWGVAARFCDLDGNAVPGVRISTAPQDFSDVPFHHWAFWQISAVRWADICSGYSDGTYRPGEPVTRDQMAVYISRAVAGGDSLVPNFVGAPTFPDVPAGFWALKYVEYAADQGVVTGYDDGHYHPEYEVNRAQMAVYVARAMVAPAGEADLAHYVPSDPRNFPDVASGFWAYKHIEYCVENGVVAGYEDGMYHPEWVVTRDQMAVYIARAFQLPM